MLPSTSSKVSKLAYVLGLGIREMHGVKATNTKRQRIRIEAVTT